MTLLIRAKYSLWETACKKFKMILSVYHLHFLKFNYTVKVVRVSPGDLT